MKLNKYIKLFIILILGISIGNRIFNHLHAWMGITIISGTLIFVVYKLIKSIKHEKVN